MLTQIACSWRGPIQEITSAGTLAAPLGRTVHDQRIRVPPGTVEGERPVDVRLLGGGARGQAAWPVIAGQLDAHLSGPHRAQPESPVRREARMLGNVRYAS
jgi:hypothetical protein